MAVGAAKLGIFLDVDRSEFGSEGGGIGCGLIFGWLISAHVVVLVCCFDCVAERAANWLNQ
jgi:hypothetical protein